MINSQNPPPLTPLQQASKDGIQSYSRMLIIAGTLSPLVGGIGAIATYIQERNILDVFSIVILAIITSALCFYFFTRTLTMLKGFNEIIATRPHRAVLRFNTSTFKHYQVELNAFWDEDQGGPTEWNTTIAESRIFFAAKEGVMLESLKHPEPLPPDEVKTMVSNAVETAVKELGIKVFILHLTAIGNLADSQETLPGRDAKAAASGGDLSL